MIINCKFEIPSEDPNAKKVTYYECWDIDSVLGEDVEIETSDGSKIKATPMRRIVTRRWIEE